MSRASNGCVRGLRGTEVSTGKVLLLAAHRAGINTIILPRDNEKDLPDIPESILRQLNIKLVERQAQHDFLYWEFPAYEGQQAVRMGKWKAIRKNIFDGNMDIELYDLDQDIREENNVAAQHPEVIAMIESIMLQEHVPPTIERFKFKELGDK